MTIEQSPMMQSARPTLFVEAVDRLKAEHDELRALLYNIRNKGNGVASASTIAAARARLQELRSDVTAMMKKLQQHADWEERELFPMLSRYFHRMYAPSILPSIWVMEKDHQLAELFVQSFMESVNGYLAGQPIPVKETVSHLVQACLILTEHLNLEEEVVYPMTEQILTDLDSLFS